MKYLGRSIVFVISILLGQYHVLLAQSFSGCAPSTPTFDVDLRNNPDSLWLSPRVVRSGLCCGYDPNAKPPIRCVQFRLTLDDDAVGIIFNIASGAIPPGALGYSIDCGPLKFPGEVVCLSGPWPKYLTFCKPGANPNTYSILSIGKPKISPPITVSDGCTGVIGVTGLNINTIKWTSVPYNPVHDSYLNCVEKCSTVVANYQPGAPDSVTYEASGQIIGNCITEPFRATTKVYFINNKKVEILPKNPVVCFGSSSATVTAYPSGGRPPYQFLWNTGQTSQSIQVGEGRYTVQVTDASSCPGTADTVTVTSFKLPIIANAGLDINVCRYNNTADPIQLNGSVQAVRGGRWSGGTGNFLPNDSTLNARYLPSSQEITNGSVTLRLTTIGNGDCPPNSDEVTMYFRDPIKVVVNDRTVCAGSSMSLIAPFNSGLSYTWSINGTVVSNSNSYSFLPVNSVNLVLSTTTSFQCVAKDTVNVLVQPRPIVSMPDQTVCTGQSVRLNAVPLNGINNMINYSWIKNGLNLGLSTSEISTVQSGKYIVFVSSGACTVSDTVEVSNFDIGVKATGPLFLCRNSNSGVNLSVNRMNTSRSRWVGEGIFTPSDTASAVLFFPSFSQLTKPMIEVFLKSEGNTGCIEATDTFRIQVEPTPILNVPEISVCLGNVTTVFSQLPDSLKPRWYSQKNVFLSSGSSFTAQFDSTTTLILKAESTSGCRDSTFAKVWAFAKPQLNIRDTTICDGASVTLNARLTNVFQGNGVYAWLRNSLPLNNSGETFVARSSGKYTVTFGLLGCQTQDSAMVNVFNIQVQASDDQYVCKNQLATGINLVSVTATSAKVKWIGNGGNFSPNDSSKTTTYLPSLAESSANASKILVQTVGNGVCKEGKDSVLVYFKPYNLAAGTFETVCEGENSLLSSPLISGMVYEWKDSQGNIIGNSHQIQVNVQRDTSFLVKITNSNACSDSVTINVKPYPKPQIQIAGATTCLGDSLSLNGVPLNKNETFVQPIFEWYKDGIKLVNQDSILKIGTSGIYKIRYGQGICIGEDTAKMVFKKSTINVNNISPICVVLGARLTLSSSFSNADSLIWNSSGTGSFENQLILGQVDYLPSNSDFSSNKITFIAQTFSKNPKCLLVKDSTEMTILPSPKASGKGDTVCVGESALLQSTISANWQTRWLSGTTPLSSQINLVIANAITQEYILVVTDPNGCKDTTTVPLLTFDKPIISLQDTSTCLGDTLLLKPIIAASPFASTNYSWYKNGLPLPEKNALLNVFESGIYKLVFGEGGCIATDDAQVIIEEPKLTLNQPAPICKNYAGVISLNASLNTNRSIKWIGAGFFAPSDSDKVATYKPSISELTLDSFSIRVETIQNLKCIGVADQIMIKTLKAPLLNAASDTVCLGDSITLKKMPNNSESVRWIENGSIKSTNNVIRFPVLSSGSILLRASSLNGCVDSILVPYATFPKPLLQLNDVQTCVGDKPVLNGIPSNTNKANEKYRWYKGNTLLSQTTSFISVSDSGTYSLLYGQGNCTATDSAKVTFLPPTLNVFGDLEICRNKKEINFGANYTHADGVEWSTVLGVLPAMYQGKLVQYPYRSGDLVNDKSILVFAKLKQNNPLCQILSDTLEVVLKESPFLITSGDTLCKATLAEVEVQQELGTTYVWQDHLSNQLSTSNRYVYTPSKSEKIFLIAQNLNGCQDSTEVDVRLVATAGVTIQNSPACTGQMVSLEMKVSNDTVTGSKNIKWYYKGNKIAENINPISTSQSGSFSVIYSNKYCTDTASKEIFYNPSPLVAKEPELVFCSEAQPELQLDAGQYYGYLWQNDTSARGRYYQVSKGGSYKVLVFNQFGCSSEKMFSVREMCKPRLFVPNAFTPNGSNNNQFKVQHANIKSYQMLIFNRWGEIIFESLDPNISWNGTYRDEMMPLGVYPWVVTYEGFADEYGPYKLQGQVTVLK